MRRERIVFWQGQPSPHQSSYLRALAQLLPRKQIVAVFAHALEEHRLQMGWQSPDLGAVEVSLSPGPAQIAHLAGSHPTQTVHIFAGLQIQLIQTAWRLCSATPALLGVMSEARQARGWKGALRRLHSYRVERPRRERVDFVLAIGHLAVDWYRSCGYHSGKIFRWGYFVEPAQAVAVPTTSTAGRSSSRVSLCFIGQCIERKGIDTLIRALATLQFPASVRIVGDGPKRRELEHLCSLLGASAHVEFTGVMSNDDVRTVLQSSDLLILPSRFDGWGAVVNEALMSGVPVVCSDQCGAADLLVSSGHGDVFRAGSAPDLARVLERWVRKGPLSHSHRQAIRSWSRCITGDSAARYLIDILGHLEGGLPRPEAPWLSPVSDGARDRAAAPAAPGESPWPA